jgi:hypothetical protein
MAADATDAANSSKEMPNFVRVASLNRCFINLMDIVCGLKKKL